MGAFTGEATGSAGVGAQGAEGMDEPQCGDVRTWGREGGRDRWAIGRARSRRRGALCSRGRGLQGLRSPDVPQWRRGSRGQSGASGSPKVGPGVPQTLCRRRIVPSFLHTAQKRRQHGWGLSPPHRRLSQGTGGGPGSPPPPLHRPPSPQETLPPKLGADREGRTVGALG